MAGVKVEIATLDAKTIDPLAKVLEQVSELGEGPVMVQGLERAVPIKKDGAPILQALNLERADWPERLRRPVVFWVSEALVGLLGRKAPDFFDWRTDTIHFPYRVIAAHPELRAFDGGLWQSGLDGRMPVRDRWARIEELRSRLRTHTSSDDAVVEANRFSWSLELANHLFLLGELDAAKEHYLQARAIAEKLGAELGLALCCLFLGAVARERGLLDEAETLYRKSLDVAEEIQDQNLIASSYSELGRVAERRGSLREAQEFYQRSMTLFEDLGDRFGIAVGQHYLGNIADQQDSLEEARDRYLKALAVFEETDNRVAAAGSYHQLGWIAEQQGSLEEARELYRKALALNEELGYPIGIAHTVSQLGILESRAGDPEEAVKLNVRSFALRRALGNPDRQIDQRWLLREREAVGEDRFRELVEEYAETPEVVSAILEATTEPLTKPAEKPSEPSAGYAAGELTQTRLNSKPR